MTLLKTVIFVDGQNFKKNLQTFKFSFDKPGKLNEYKLDEKHFKWDVFFERIIEEFNQKTHLNHQLIRTYWYNAARIRPFIKNNYQAQKTIDEYQNQIHGLTIDKIFNLAEKWHDSERKSFYKTRDEIFEKIQRENDFLEFRHIGEYVVEPLNPHKFFKNDAGELIYMGTRRSEKGVDVGIAVDMVAKMNSYDVAILVSGDSDFLPVVNYLKDNLKLVYQFSIAHGVPPKIKYLSPWLKGKVDSFGYFDEVQLLEEYLDRKSSIPQSILDKIDKRIEELGKLYKNS